MGRTLMYTTIALLAIFVLSSYVLLKHGGEGLSQVKTLSIHELTAQASAYDGANVTVNGVVAYNNDLKTFELTAPDQNYPLPLSGLSDDQLAQFEGKTVTVAGKFVYESNKGTHIEVGSVHEVTTPTPVPVPSVRPG